jgi:hypothetical protein
LATGIFTLWDRLFRARPIAYVHVRGPKGTAYRYVRITNTDKADIQVTDVQCWPPIFAAAKDHSIRSIADAALGKAPLALIAPSEDWDFTLIIPSSVDFDALKDRKLLVLAIFWRRSSSPWLPQPPKVIVLSVRDFRRLEASPRPLFGHEEQKGRNGGVRKELAAGIGQCPMTKKRRVYQTRIVDGQVM